MTYLLLHEALLLLFVLLSPSLYRPSPRAPAGQLPLLDCVHQQHHLAPGAVQKLLQVWTWICVGGGGQRLLANQCVLSCPSPRRYTSRSLRRLLRSDPGGTLGSPTRTSVTAPLLGLPNPQVGGGRGLKSLRLQRRPSRRSHTLPVVPPAALLWAPFQAIGAASATEPPASTAAVGGLLLLPPRAGPSPLADLALHLLLLLVYSPDDPPATHNPFRR